MTKLNKKALLTLGLIGTLGLTACGNKAQNNQAGDNSSAITEEVTEGTVTEEGTTEETTEETAEETTVEINEEAQAKLDEIHQAVKDAYGENYYPDMQLDADMLKDVYGLNPDLYDAVVAEVPMISNNVDVFIAVHPTEGNKEAVLTALNNYRDVLVADTMQYPLNLAKIQAATVYESGDYVFFFMLGTIDDMIEDEDERLALFTEQNKIAIDVIDSMTK